MWRACWCLASVSSWCNICVLMRHPPRTHTHTPTHTHTHTHTHTRAQHTTPRRRTMSAGVAVPASACGLLHVSINQDGTCVAVGDYKACAPPTRASAHGRRPCCLQTKNDARGPAPWKPLGRQPTHDDDTCPHDFHTRNNNNNNNNNDNNNGQDDDDDDDFNAPNARRTSLPSRASRSSAATRTGCATRTSSARSRASRCCSHRRCSRTSARVRRVHARARASARLTDACLCSRDPCPMRRQACQTVGARVTPPSAAQTPLLLKPRCSNPARM